MYPLVGVTGPYALAVGPDNRLWFTAVNQIGRFDSGTKTVTLFANPGDDATGIAASPTDHSLWFANFFTSTIGRITTGGTITDRLSAPWLTYPHGITRGGDGALWFTTANWTLLGRVDTVTRSMTEHTNPVLGSGTSIAAGPDGAMWTNSHSTNGSVYRLTTGGTAQQLTPTWPTRLLETGDLVTGSDGAMWLRWGGYSALARVTTKVTPQIDGLSPTSGATGSVVVIQGINLTGATAVAFNGAPAVFGVWDDTDVVAVVPNGTTRAACHGDHAHRHRLGTDVHPGHVTRDLSGRRRG